MNNLKKLITKILHLRTFWKMEMSKRSTNGVPLSSHSLLNGFLSISPVLYNFSENNSKQYLSDWARLHKASKINDKRKIVLDNKLIFQQMNKHNEFVKPIVARSEEHTSELESRFELV